jgi:hypothetical protein
MTAFGGLLSARDRQRLEELAQEPGPVTAPEPPGGEPGPERP